MKPPGSRERARGHRSASAATVAVLAILLLAAAACKADKPRYPPDATLRRELGLTDHDEVHRVTLLGADTELVRPQSVSVPTGAYVEFVTGDGRIHEVHFELDSLSDTARAFLQKSDQAASPPLVDLGSRFVVHFLQAPPGRYPFLVEGNDAPGRGVVVVRPNP